jgi:putative phage-type endonuclease
MDSKIIDLDQGTSEWREARIGLLTGSRIAPALGISGAFSSRKTLLREMVAEANGVYKNISSEPMRWGTEHEDIARREVEKATGLDFSDRSMRVNGRLGYSPDGVDGDTLLEVKCPWGLRNDLAPAFKSIWDMPSYMMQIQLGMYLTGCTMCVFAQWTPNALRIEEVTRGEHWFALHEDLIIDFLSEYTAKLGDKDFVEALTARGDAQWEIATTALKRAQIASEEAVEWENHCKAELITLAGENDCHGCGYRVAHITTKGRVNNKDLFSAFKITGPDQDQFRGPATQSIRVSRTK